MASDDVYQGTGVDGAESQGEVNNTTSFCGIKLNAGAERLWAGGCWYSKTLEHWENIQRNNISCNREIRERQTEIASKRILNRDEYIGRFTVSRRGYGAEGAEDSQG